MKHLLLLSLCMIRALICLGDTGSTPDPFEGSPRIINIVNFIRQTDYRLENADALLFQAVEEQLVLVNKYKLPATFLLQYDALIRSEYQQLLKTQLGKDSEVGGWFEITQPQVEAAGLKWRGEYTWVSHANIAFSTGYTKEEREKLVDVYMVKFKEIFGAYPQSMGSWYIDAHTLGYMYDKYGITASCNCKDQIGTDGYTLWGGYWNQAYYPSRLNGYMPAQTEEGQIPVPVFRMLGSDPIYQYDDGLGSDRQGVTTLEPVYEHAGMNKQWVEYFLKSIVDQPCLAFNYAQAGQENSFTWNGMRKGLEIQILMLDSLRQLHKIRVETLGESGKWFKENYKTTPATAVTALCDIRKEGNKTVWFNSRYYRANLLWKGSAFMFRDIHLFDERLKSDYVDQAGKGDQFLFYTLPLVDGFIWSKPNERAGMRIVQQTDSGQKKEVEFKNPVVKELENNVLLVECEDTNNHLFKFLFNERGFEVWSEATGKNFEWCMELSVAESAGLPFTAIFGKQIKGRFKGFDYTIACRKGKVEVAEDCVFRLSPEKNRIALDCTNGK